jgi:hypothetical protein
MIDTSKVKGYFTKQNIALAMACLVFLFEVGRLFHGDNVPGIDAGLKRDMENLKASDVYRAKEVAGIREQRAKDSIRLASIQLQVEGVPGIINQITAKYEKDRVNLASQSVDSRLQFFANSLSQEGDSSNRGNHH